jgi:hypothetical protein
LVEDDLRRGANILSACLAIGHFAYGGAVSRVAKAAEVYARSTNQFAAAVFLKPATTANADLARQLAPLILQQVWDKQGSAGSPTGPLDDAAFTGDVPVPSSAVQQGSFHRAISASNNVSSAVLPRPAVFYAADSVQVGSRAHLRFSYEWFYAPGDAPGLRALTRQGIRITLDTRGQPAVWEVLADTSGLRLMFVSQGLEAAAAAQFGKPLPGRRYAIERSLNEAPGVIVPRVIDDGPVVMGPIVYLIEGSRDVSTLICRCMPAQVKRLVATETFDLAAFEGAAVSAFLASAGAASNAPPVLWPTDDRVENRLDHCLRLPAGF